MTTLKINVPNDKLEFILELINSFDFVEIIEGEDVPQWQIEASKKRLEAYKNNPSSARSVNVVMDEIKTKYGL